MSVDAKYEFMVKRCEAVPASCLSFFTIFINFENESEWFPKIPLLDNESFQENISTALVSHYRVVYPSEKELALFCAELQVRYGNFYHS